MSQPAAAPGTILVTGAAGFVGTRLLPALRRNFPALRVVGTSHDPAPDPAPDPAHDRTPALVALDVTDRAAVRALVGALRPTACVHLAAQSSVDQAFADPAQSYAVNLGGTLNLAQAVLELSPAAAFVLASSGEIYGLTFRHGEPLGEEALLAPTNPYAAAKAAADLAVGELALRGLRAVRLRLFNHTGAGQSARFALPNFARQVAAIAAGRQSPLLETGDLDRWRDLLDIDDVVRAYLAVLASRQIFAGEIFNVASGQPRHLRAIVAALIDRAGVAARVVERQGPRRPHDLPYSAGRPERFMAAFAWAPTVPWPATLDALLDDWSRRLQPQTG